MQSITLYFIQVLLASPQLHQCFSCSWMMATRNYLYKVQTTCFLLIAGGPKVFGLNSLCLFFSLFQCHRQFGHQQRPRPGRPGPWGRGGGTKRGHSISHTNSRGLHSCHTTWGHSYNKGWDDSRTTLILFQS